MLVGGLLLQEPTVQKKEKKNRTDLCVREEKGKGPAACGPSVSGLGRWSWQLGLLVGQMEKT